jgi:hypothetical protein
VRTCTIRTCGAHALRVLRLLEVRQRVAHPRNVRVREQHVHPRSQQWPDLRPAARLPVELHVLAVGAEEAGAGGSQLVLGLLAQKL